MAITTAGPGIGHAHGTGPFESLKGLGRTAIDIVHTRFDLLVTEIAEEQVRLAELLLYAALSLLSLFLAVVIVAVFVVATLWDTEYRMLATGVIAAALLLSGIGCGMACVRKAKEKPRLFSSSLDELGADLERLK
jgi:uncharacterized membrane protein YqjE